MANNQRSAVRHHRTRKDHSTETAEDYVEAIAEVIANKEICRVSDLANLFGVSHVTVSRIVNRLHQEGWLNTKPYYPIELTTKGKRLAAEAKHRHQVVLEFLLAIGVDLGTAEIDSEGIEHHVSKVTLDAMQRFTNRHK